MIRIEKLSEPQILDLHRLYRNEWWSKHRTMEQVRRVLAGTPIVIAFAEPATERLAAFARVITDYTFKALILDVIVDPAHRATGLGRALVDAAVFHPDLARVENFELYCRPELIPLYERWGFREVGRDVRFMRRET